MIRFKVGPNHTGKLWCVLCNRCFGDPDFEVVIFEDQRVWGPVCFDCLRSEPKEFRERMKDFLRLYRQAKQLCERMGPANRIRLKKWAEHGFPMPSAEAIQKARSQMEKTGKPEEVKQF